MNIAYYCEVCLHVSGASAKGMRIYIWRKISKLLDFSLYKPEWYYEYSNPCLSVHFALMMINFQSCTFYTDKKFPALKYIVNFWICTWWGKYYFSSNPHRTFMSPNICSLNQMHDEWVFFILSLYWAIVHYIVHQSPGIARTNLYHNKDLFLVWDNDLHVKKGSIICTFMILVLYIYKCLLFMYL